MIWLLAALLLGLALTPAALALRTRLRTRGTRDLAVALHRAQLLDLDRDAAEGRILPAEHQAAVLEVQRRLLAAAAQQDREAGTGARWPLLAMLVLVPAAAAGLYSVTGKPSMPSVTASQQQAVQEEELLTQLRQQIAKLDPMSERARQGYILLGSVEESRGNAPAAAEAFRTALRAKFDPMLAARTAEAESRAQGGVSEASAALFRQALAAAPADAPWRSYVEQRLSEPRLP